MYLVRVKNSLVLSFCVFLFPLALFSQQISESDLMRISEELLDSILNERVSDDRMYVRQNDCLYGVEDDLTLSCFTIDWNLNWVGDLNGDSLSDLMLRIEDLGLGAGRHGYT